MVWSYIKMGKVGMATQKFSHTNMHTYLSPPTFIILDPPLGIVFHMIAVDKAPCWRQLHM